MNTKVVLIIPYFGAFPNYFNYWLKSANENINFDFLIFTDNKEYQSYKNVQYIYCTFEDFKEKLQACVEFKIVLDRPYKICDYRPLYGMALQKYISKYDFWGFCDIDLIFGDIGKFITNDVLNKYDKVCELGHFTLLRNNKQCNELWRIKHHIPGAYRYDEAFKTPYSCHFDETDGLTPISKYKNIKTYTPSDFADIDRTKYNFLVLNMQNKLTKSLFTWNKGKLYYYYILEGKIQKKEYMYAHFQKRKMKVTKCSTSEDSFSIVPNEFVNSTNFNDLLDQEKIIDKYPYYVSSRKKELKEKFRTHAIQQRLYRSIFQKIYRYLLDRR